MIAALKRHWPEYLMNHNDVIIRRNRGRRRHAASLAIDGALGFREALMVRDPDAHALRVVQQ